MQKQVVVQDHARQPIQKSNHQTTKISSREQDPAGLMFQRYLGARNLQRLQTEHSSGSTLPAGERVVQSDGEPLEPSTKRFFEPLFSHKFANVRIHTGKEAAESAKALNAKAYTVGNDIVFGAGQYAPGTKTGKRLIAHELAHVVQQERSPSISNTVGARQDVYEQAAEAVAHLATIFPEIDRPSSRPIFSNITGSFHTTPALQKQDEGTTPDTRVDDPNFLVCLILCYLGLPPAIWKWVVELFLRAVWEEYQGTYDRESAEKNFRSYREEFRLYSTFKKMQIVLTFAIQGKIGLIPIRFAAAKWIQAQMIKIFIAMGATMAALGIAEQVARKVAIAVEVVFAAGCGVYCGSVAVAQNIVEVSTYIAEGIDATMDILKSFGTAIGAIFSRPLLVLKARLDPLNWDLSSLPSQTQTDIGLLGLDLWDMIGTETVNTFLTDLSRPLSSFEISPDMIQIIAQEMSESTLPITGLEFVFTPDLILGLTPVEFVELLQDWQFMEFLRDPWQIADEALAAQPE